MDYKELNDNELIYLSCENMVNVIKFEKILIWGRSFFGKLKTHLQKDRRKEVL